MLDQVACPVVAVHGRRDELVPFANTAYLEAHLPNAASVRLVPLDEADHFIPWTHEAEVREVVRMLSEQTQSTAVRE
ncbi:alpha/beta hydrolase [Phycisphaeraceae bacterium D3-23]